MSWKKQASTLPALLLCVTLCLLSLSGCKGDPSGKIFYYDIGTPVANLDPQFATDATARMILSNLYEGLVVLGADSEILPGVAESHSVSADSLLYRFQLRQDAAWSNEIPLTAQDFVYAFHRIFRDGSPHAGRFLSLKNAAAILDGQMDVSALGVRAEGDHVLVMELGEPDPLFLSALTDPSAAPCNREAFEASRGRYGLDQSNTCVNGPFYLRNWDDTRLQLRANEQYRSQLPVLAAGVNFNIREDAPERFLSGRTDLALLTREQQEQVSSSRADILPIQKTVWCIVFNQDHPVWGNPLLRQGLALSLDHNMMADVMPTSFQPTSVLAPDAMRVMGKPYRELAFAESPLAFDTQRAARLFSMGLEAARLDQLPATSTILIPEEAKSSLNMGGLQQGWQKNLAAYINFEVVSASQIQNRLRAGDYQMLLMPMTPGDSNIATLLNAFTSGSGQNYFGYRNIVYDELLETAASQHTPEQAAARYAQAETILLSDAVVIPVYFETSYLAVASGVRDLIVSPFGDEIYFKYAQKDS